MIHPEQLVGIHIADLAAYILRALPKRLKDRMIDILVRHVGNDLDELVHGEFIVICDAQPLQIVVSSPLAGLVVRHAGKKRRRTGRTFARPTCFRF